MSQKAQPNWLIFVQSDFIGWQAQRVKYPVTIWGSVLNDMTIGNRYTCPVN